MVVSLSHTDERRIPTSVSFETATPTSHAARRLSDIVQPTPSHPSKSPTLTRNRRVSSASSSSHSNLKDSQSLSHNPPTTSSTSPSSTTISPTTATPRSMLSHRTRSDDDCDYNGVVLRTKSTNSMVAPTHTSIPALSTAKSKNSMDRSASIPITSTTSPDTDDPRSSPNSRDIDHIRSFLESEYVAPTDEFWHMQRDSFIHRSYNKKLLARKNAIDAFETPKRPASMPASNHTTHQPIPIPLPTTDDNQSHQPVKRDSFIRNSFNSLRRSFSFRTSSSKKKSAQMERRSARLTRAMTDQDSALDKRNERSIHNNNNSINRDGFTVSDEGERWDQVMDPGGMTFLNVPLENVRNLGHTRNSSTSSCTSNR